MKYVKDVDGKELHGFNFVTSESNTMYYIGIEYVLIPLCEKLTQGLARTLRLKLFTRKQIIKLRDNQ